MHVQKYPIERLRKEARELIDGTPAIMRKEGDDLDDYITALIFYQETRNSGGVPVTDYGRLELILAEYGKTLGPLSGRTREFRVGTTVFMVHEDGGMFFSRYLGEVKLKETSLRRILVNLEALQMEVLAVLAQKRQERNRAVTMAMVTQPLLESLAREKLSPRNIVWKVERSEDKLWLDVHIIDDRWIRASVTSDNAGNIVSHVPYLRNRPDCIKRDGKALGFFIMEGEKR